EKEIQRVWRRRRQGLATAPGALEVCCWRPRVHASGREMDRSMVLLHAHARPKEREAQGQACSEDGKGIRGLEREEPDPRHTLHMHVRAHVELMRLAQHGQRGKEEGPHPPHGEGRHAHPGSALEGVKAQPGGEQRLQKLCRNGPMQKEQLAPPLIHDWPARRPCPDCQAIDHHTAQPCPVASWPVSPISCTRPTSPVVRRTLMPREWKGDFVRMSFTIP